MRSGNGNGKNGANGTSKPVTTRCAIYTRKSTEEGLDQAFNSLDAQREACEAFIASQRHEGWVVLPDHYDDGGFSGANMERPGLKKLLQHVAAGHVDGIVVYKVDRLSRSLLDFARIIELLEKHHVSFVSVTQQFNTATSMGRLSLHVLLSFAQYEREIIGERIRDKVAASKRKGKYMGGTPPLGYDVDREAKKLVVNPDEARLVRHVFSRFLAIGSATRLARELNADGHTTKSWRTVKGNMREGRPWDKSHLYRLLNNRILIGRVSHKGDTFPGEHEAIIEDSVWEKVQKVLADNTRSCSDKTRCETTALLKGLIKCGHCGNAMGPTFTRKDGKTYRYYLCVHAGKSGHDACPLKSVAAGEVDGAVLTQLREMIGAPELIAKEASISDESAASLRNMAHLWDELFPGEQTRIARMMIERVTVYTDRLHLSLQKEGFHSLIAKLGDKAEEPVGACPDDPGVVEITIPIELKRRRGRKQIILPPGASARASHEESLDPVVIAVARAHQWLKLLESGRIASLSELARSLKLDGSYVHRILSLTALSPEIIANIVNEKGAGYSLARLTKGFPAMWSEQEAIFLRKP